MVRWSYGLFSSKLKFKVAQMTLQRETPFTNSIPRASQLKLFNNRHPRFTMRMSKGLEVERARGFCPLKIASFYLNVELIYITNNYEPHQIWNANESGVQARKNGQGRVLAVKATKSVHSIIPNSREWQTTP